MAAGGVRRAASGLFDASFVHDIEITYDQGAYEKMIAAFQSTGDKTWLEATVVIDGTTYARAGIRLKGNSSLMGLRRPGGANGGGGDGGGVARGPGGGADASTPNALPWLVRLDKYVKGQNHKGSTEMVVRSNTTQTALNEAVAQELLARSGQVSQLAFATRFSVNGSAEKLRLVVENPSDEWDDENFVNDGVLYKAESGGDYSYRGDDAASYEDIFDQETNTDVVNFAPLTRFLKFINEADDATFAAELGDYLEIDAFAKYLAGQDLVANSDDIDGPGNNSYLRWDEKTGRMTILSWDLNLAFGTMGGGGGAAFPGGGRTRGQAANGQAPNGQLPNGQLPNGGRGGFGGRSNILVTRFKANAEFNARYEAALAEMRASIYGSGVAAEVLATWKTLLTEQASDLVPTATIDQEAAAIARYFTA